VVLDGHASWSLGYWFVKDIFLLVWSGGGGVGGETEKGGKNVLGRLPAKQWGRGLGW